MADIKNIDALAFEPRILSFKDGREIICYATEELGFEVIALHPHYLVNDDDGDLVFLPMVRWSDDLFYNIEKTQIWNICYPSEVLFEYFREYLIEMDRAATEEVSDEIPEPSSEKASEIKKKLH